MAFALVMGTRAQTSSKIIVTPLREGAGGSTNSMKDVGWSIAKGGRTVKPRFVSSFLKLRSLPSQEGGGGG
jgi:hypothetical protein